MLGGASVAGKTCFFPKEKKKIWLLGYGNISEPKYPIIGKHFFFAYTICRKEHKVPLLLHNKTVYASVSALGSIFFLLR
jgi:hypothetical protein